MKSFLNMSISMLAAKISSPFAPRPSRKRKRSSTKVLQTFLLEQEERQSPRRTAATVDQLSRSSSPSSVLSGSSKSRQTDPPSLMSMMTNEILEELPPDFKNDSADRSSRGVLLSDVHGRQAASKKARTKMGASISIFGRGKEASDTSTLYSVATRHLTADKAILDIDDSAWDLRKGCSQQSSLSKTMENEIPKSRASSRLPAETQIQKILPRGEYMRKLTTPREKSIQHQVWVQLGNLKPSSTLETDVRVHPSNSIFVLYRWISCQVAAGFFQSTVVKLQDMLSEGYDEAFGHLKSIEEETMETNGRILHLLELRDRLAGLWCIYAHTILDIGRQLLLDCNQGGADSKVQHMKCKNSPQRNRESTKQTGHHGSPRERAAQQRTTFSFQDIQNHVLAILRAAKECPLVGNQSDVVLAHSRFIVAGFGLQSELKGERSSISMLPVISDAIASCWDSMDFCHLNNSSTKHGQGRSTAEKSMIYISKHQYRQRQFRNEPRLSEDALLRSMKSVFDLPSRVREPFDLQFTVVNDRNAIRVLCTELNRLSRLQEVLEKRFFVKIEKCAGTAKFLEELPFFRVYGCPSETSNEGARWSDLTHAQVNDSPITVRKMEWLW